MTTVVNANPYKPSKLKIVSLGVGIQDDTNASLNLDDTTSMIVSERREVKGDNDINQTFGLIVDDQGIGVNYSLEDRQSGYGQYAMQVDGSVFISGSVVACNIIAPSGGSSNYWIMGSRETQNIYYPGGVTLGNDGSSRNNTHTLNVVQSADRNINHAQISVQNVQASQLRLGIVGTSNVSPAVINTRAGVPIEFHASRGKDYFDSVYKRWYYSAGVLCNVPAEVPYYSSPDVSPHMIIDAQGNLGVHTSAAPKYSFEIRMPNPNQPDNIIFPTKTEYMNLAVAGNTYSCNILIWDYESQSARNIDSLYVRRLGVTIQANQIIPGPFAMGKYSFISDVDVTGRMNVDGIHHVTDLLKVDNMTDLNHLNARDAILFDVASFCNDVYVNRDIIIKESMRLRGGLFTEMIDGDNMVWCNIQFTVAQQGFSNINYYGAGFTTPGRVGVGINPNYDEVNHQFVVKKRLDQIYEMELSAPTRRLYKSAFIGHPPVDNAFMNDASTVFATPGSHDPDFNLYGYADAPQNFYFYPGSFNYRIAEPIVTPANPPVLNVNTTKRVGILTFYPQAELDVNGSVKFSGDLYNGDSKVGIWQERLFPVGGGGTITALEYYRPGVCSNVAINTIPDFRYGVVMGGGLKSIDGYYTGDDKKIVPWIDSAYSQNAVADAIASSMYTFRNVGVGVTGAAHSIDVQSQYFQQPTCIRLNRPALNGDLDAISCIMFDGLNSPWVIRNNDDKKTLEFGYGSNAFMSDTSKRAMWMKMNEYGNQQVVIGGSLQSASADYVLNHPNPNASLVVDGGLAVLGDVSINGKYIINGREMVNSNINIDFALQNSLGNDDVYIAGGSVYVNPTTKLAVGYDAARVQAESASKTLFRVYQRDASVPVIASFTCEGPNGYLEVANTSGNVVRIGFWGDPGFSILNQDNQPYLSFKTDDYTGDNMMGVNATKAITANLHVQTTNTGSNMLRLTRFYTTTNAGDSAPEIELENRFENDIGLQAHDRWVIRGPNTAYNQKLSLVYGNKDTVNKELFSFTNNGCFGIGNTQPEYAIDVAATGLRGALRLYNTSSDPTPQVIFQSGSPQYSQDRTNDYRLYSQSNTFTLDVANTDLYKPLLNFGSNNNLGIGKYASSKYGVDIDGTLNVMDTIYINGNPLFSNGSDDASEGFYFKATNVFLVPKIEYSGGVYVNRQVSSSNVFHVNAGCNANLVVFDSPIFEETQVHLRGLSGAGNGLYTIYRLEQSNQYFQIEHNPNSGTDAFVSDTHDGYNQVVRWGPSKREAGDYDVRINGSVEMVSSAPVISMADAVFGYSNANLYAIPALGSNFGVGTAAPTAKLTVVSDGGNVALSVSQSSPTKDILRLTASDRSQRFTVTSTGHVGVGTTMPLAPVHVSGSFFVTSAASNQTPSFFIRDDTLNIGVGTADPRYKLDVMGGSRFRDLVYIQNVRSNCILCLDHPSGNPTITSTNFCGFGVASSEFRYSVTDSSYNHVFRANDTELVRISGVGNIGIGTPAPMEKLQVEGNIALSGVIYPITNTVQNLGAGTNRFRSAYFANSVDIAGTALKVNNVGSLRVVSGNLEQPASVIGQSFIATSVATGSNVEFRIGESDPIVFTARNANGIVTDEFTPFLKSSLTGGVAIGTLTPQALFHVVGNSAIPAMIVDHINPSATDVMVIRNNGSPIINFTKTGNIGIGTTTPVAPFHINSSALFTQPSPTLNTATFVATSSGNQVIIDGTGNVGVGTATPLTPLHVQGSQLVTGFADFNSDVHVSGNIEVEGNSFVHGDQTTDSDRRLKSDITEIRNALDKVCTLTGYTFNKVGCSSRSTGLIAQEVAEVLPEAVIENPDTGYLSVAYGNMMGLIISAIKELKERVDELTPLAI
jgi:hypothetical protein